MKKIINKFVKILLLMIVVFSTLVIPTKVISLTDVEVKENAVKGDIYNPQTNSLTDSAIISANNYADNKNYKAGDVEVQKIVSKTDVEGKYKVEFKIRGKNTIEGVETINPVYVVVVLDRSNSTRHDNKWDNAVSASKSFAVNLLKKIPTAHLALVEFSGKGDNTNWSDAEVIRQFANSNFDNTNFGDYGKNGGATNLGEGLRYAYNLLNFSNIPQNAYKYVIVLSDGDPTVYTDDSGNTQGNGYNYELAAHEYATKWANDLKTNLNAHIFSLGYDITSGSDAESVLKGIASTESYYVEADTGDIVNKFKNVVTKFDVEYNAGTNVKIIDQLGDAFTLSNGDNTLTLDTITEEWIQLETFYITIDKDSTKGWYPTNNGFKVTYNNYKGNEKEIICNDNPEVYWEQEKYQYTINYYFNNKLDKSFTKNKEAYFKSSIFAKDNYLEDIKLQDKNENDNTTYFLDPNNSNNTSSITIASDVNENVLNIYYIDTNFTDESINKFTSVDIINNSNTIIPYTIEYSVDVNNVRNGDKVTTIITDTLPHDIDESKSDLNEGKYNKENKTVTWTFEEEVNEFNEKYVVSKKIDYNVVYKDFADISSSDNNNLVNSVNGYTKVNDKKTKGVDDKENIEALIEGKVIAIYVDKNGNKLTDDYNYKGLVGEEYTTNPKDILEYTLIEVVGDVNGKIKEGTIEVTYIYDLTPLPPHTGLNKNNSTVYIKYGLYFVLILILIKLIRKIYFIFNKNSK